MGYKSHATELDRLVWAIQEDTALAGDIIDEDYGTAAETVGGHVRPFPRGAGSIRAQCAIPMVVKKSSVRAWADDEVKRRLAKGETVSIFVDTYLPSKEERYVGATPPEKDLRHTSPGGTRWYKDGVVMYPGVSGDTWVTRTRVSNGAARGKIAALLAAGYEVVAETPQYVVLRKPNEPRVERHVRS